MSGIRWAILCVWCLVSTATLSAETIVIWDFATREGAKTTTTRNLTFEFEEALVQRGTYVVLERRELGRLEAVIQNEKALSDIGQISPSDTKEFKKIGAEGVIFGDVYDDVESGEVTVTVTLQDFQGRKQLIKSVSLRRGLLTDAKSRREAMTELATDVSDITDTGGEAGGKSAMKELPRSTVPVLTNDQPPASDDPEAIIRVAELNNLSVAAEKLVKAGKLKEAIAKLEAFQQQYPDTPQAHDAAMMINQIRQEASKHE